jgi:hypothetical protein
VARVLPAIAACEMEFWIPFNKLFQAERELVLKVLILIQPTTASAQKLFTAAAKI